MKVLFGALAITAFGFSANAQNLPQPSPSAAVSQTIGLTEVTVEYSRPGVKGRTIWGDLVPYDQVWRTGANASTKIEFSTDVVIGGEEVPAGKYSIFTKPGQIQWTVWISPQLDLWGVDGFDPAKATATFKAEPKKHAFTERMEFSFSEVKDNGGTLTLAWENVAVDMPIKVDTDAQAWKNIETAISENPEDWRVYRNAATYTRNQGKELEKGLGWIKKSLELKNDSWYSHFVHAQLLYMNGDSKAAKKAAKKALEMGEAEAKADGKEFGYAEMINNEMLDW